MHRVFHTVMQRRLILSGAVLVWLLFVASFLMPVAKGMDLAGWQAFWFYVAEMWDTANYWRQIQQNPLAIFISTFASTNGLVFVAPVVLFRWPRLSGWVAGFLMFGGLVPLFGFFGGIIKNEFRIGFYCWLISIFLMALLCLLEWRRQRRSHHREKLNVV